jgi:uncharacterized protein (DUF111 family)
LRAAFFDMIGGASGNMLFGAFVDAGADFDAIVNLLGTIPVDGWSIVRRRTQRRGVEATYIDVVIPGEDDHHEHPDAHRHPPGTRTFADVVRIFEESQLSGAQVAMAHSIAERLALTEAHETGMTLERRRFHPVGQIDAILDIAATCIAIELLGVERVFCSAFPIEREDFGAQRVTATGAAILSTLVEEPGVRPGLRVERSGYGAGRSDFPVPNVIRVEIGQL